MTEATATKSRNRQAHVAYSAKQAVITGGRRWRRARNSLGLGRFLGAAPTKRSPRRLPIRSGLISPEHLGELAPCRRPGLEGLTGGPRIIIGCVKAPRIAQRRLILAAADQAQGCRPQKGPGAGARPPKDGLGEQFLASPQLFQRSRKGREKLRVLWTRISPALQLPQVFCAAIGRQMRRAANGGLTIKSKVAVLGLANGRPCRQSQLSNWSSGTSPIGPSRALRRASLIAAAHFLEACEVFGRCGHWVELQKRYSGDPASSLWLS